MKSILLVASLFTASMCAPAVTITSGSFTHDDPSNGQFHFISSNFDLKGGTGIGSWTSLYGPVEPSVVVNLSGQVSGFDIFGGSGWIGETYYPDLRYSHLMGPGSIFDFTAPSFTYASEHVKTSPFQFSGVISAYAGNDPDCLLCSVPIEGGGISVISYNVFDYPGRPPGIGEPIQQTYLFTPEPATAYLLLPGGLLFLFLRNNPRWRRFLSARP